MKCVCWHNNVFTRKLFNFYLSMHVIIDLNYWVAEIKTSIDILTNYLLFTNSVLPAQKRDSSVCCHSLLSKELRKRAMDCSACNKSPRKIVFPQRGASCEISESVLRDIVFRFTAIMICYSEPSAIAKSLLNFSFKSLYYLVQLFLVQCNKTNLQISAQTSVVRILFLKQKMDYQEIILERNWFNAVRSNLTRNESKRQSGREVWTQ